MLIKRGSFFIPQTETPRDSEKKRSGLSAGLRVRETDTQATPQTQLGSPFKDQGVGNCVEYSVQLGDPKHALRGYYPEGILDAAGALNSGDIKGPRTCNACFSRRIVQRGLRTPSLEY